MEKEKETKQEAWLRACRLYSLPASIMPIFVGIVTAYAYLQRTNNSGTFEFIPAICCLLFGLLAQIACNMANDYFDYRSGVDKKEKTQKKRVLLEGAIRPQSLLYASISLLFLACLFGLVTIAYAGWSVLLIGISAAIAVYAYTAGPYPLAYNALGDICVLFFYGFCAVGGTFFVLTGGFNTEAAIYSLSMGLLINNIMMVNNYRDREIDREAGKKTVANLVSAATARTFYLLGGLLPVLLCCSLYIFKKEFTAFTLIFAFLMPHLLLWQKLGTSETGEDLNKLLTQTGQLVVVFGALLILGVFLSM